MKQIIYVMLLAIVFVSTTTAQSQKIVVPRPVQQYLLFKAIGLDFSLPMIAAPDDTDITKLVNGNIAEEYKYSIRSDIFPPYEKLLKPYFQKITGQLLTYHGLKKSPVQIVPKSYECGDRMRFMMLCNQTLIGELIFTPEHIKLDMYKDTNIVIADAGVKKYHNLIKKLLIPINRPDIADTLDPSNNAGLEGWVFIPDFSIENFYKVATYLKKSGLIMELNENGLHHAFKFYTKFIHDEKIQGGFIYLYDEELGLGKAFSQVMKAQKMFGNNERAEMLTLYQLLCIAAVTNQKFDVTVNIFQIQLNSQTNGEFGWNRDIGITRKIFDSAR